MFIAAQHCNGFLMLNQPRPLYFLLHCPQFLKRKWIATIVRRNRYLYPFIIFNLWPFSAICKFVNCAGRP